MTTGTELSGFTVGVTADRRAQEQTLLLERLGARVVRGPTIKTLPVVGADELRSVTESVIADPPDYLVANTGLGIRSWFGLAETWGRDQQLRRALSATRVAARGPKAAGAVGIAGLEVWWRAENEQLAAVGERLVAEGVAGRRVAVQLHGDDRQPLTELLRAAGAVVLEVRVYRWTLPDDPGPARRLIDLCCSGAVDAVTFTAGPALRNLFRLAEEAERREELVGALNGPVTAACIGPVCAATAAEEGVRGVVVPDRWRLGSLVGALAVALGAGRRRFVVGGHELVVQGSVAVVDGQLARLTDRERGVLACLARQPGATVGRAALLHEVWNDPKADPHVLEATVARLRSKLGPAGDAIETAVRRGYRLSLPDPPAITA
ncbi:MAG TPA: uroporphyrinogen-III synthase [Acidimicrobiales bacterium]|nr:uroporphyrinogen-III synthase [Acidimicrobiales bacterium]